jgi:hypothetical protein
MLEARVKLHVHTELASRRATVCTGNGPGTCKNCDNGIARLPLEIDDAVLRERLPGKLFIGMADEMQGGLHRVTEQ